MSDWREPFRHGELVYDEPDGLIICGDCRDILPEFPEKSVDLVLTDPPYGIANKWKGGKGHGWGQARLEGIARNRWDVSPPSAETMGVILAAAEKQIIWGGNYFNLPPSRCWLIWNKPERGFTLAEAELAWTNADNVVRVFDWNRHAKDKFHPTQKPLPLFKWCLRQSWSEASHLVLDPYLGSGTTALACLSNNRCFIGIEISRGYCELAADRVRAAKQGTKLSEYRQGQKPLF